MLFKVETVPEEKQEKLPYEEITDRILNYSYCQAHYSFEASPELKKTLSADGILHDYVCHEETCPARVTIGNSYFCNAGTELKRLGELYRKHINIG